MATLLSRAIRYLALREHTRSELRRKLLKVSGPDSRSRSSATDADIWEDDFEFESPVESPQEDVSSAPAPEEAVEAVLDQLEEQGLLSDQRFGEAWIRSHQRRHGRMRLEQDLRSRGVSQELIGTLLAGWASELPISHRAWQVWSRRFSTPPETPAERARQIRFLLGRGFSLDDFRALEKSNFRPPEFG